MTTKELNKHITNLFTTKTFADDAELAAFTQELRTTYNDLNVFTGLRKYFEAKQQSAWVWIVGLAYDALVKNNPDVVPFEHSRSKQPFKKMLFVAGYSNKQSNQYLLFDVSKPLAYDSFQLAYRSTPAAGIMSLLNQIMESWAETVDDFIGLFDMSIHGLGKIKIRSSVYKPNPKVTFADMKADLPLYIK